KVVRTATGPNTQPGGSEALESQVWDVRELRGKSGRLEAVDKATGGWGHINVDQILLSDSRPPAVLADASRDFIIEKRYLNLPIRGDAPVRKVTVLVDGRKEQQLDMRLSDKEPEWWAVLDAGRWRGNTLTLRVDKLREDSSALREITQDDAIRESADLYRER